MQDKPYAGVAFGNTFVQIGSYRFGLQPGKGFWLVFGGENADGRGSRAIFNCMPNGSFNEGPFEGEANSYLWNLPLRRRPEHVEFGDRAIRFKHWVVAAQGPGGGHLFIGSDRTNNVCLILRKDGTVHRGPRENPAQKAWPSEAGPWNSHGERVVVAGRYLQLGPWRVGSDAWQRFSFVNESERRNALVCRHEGRVIKGPFDGPRNEQLVRLPVEPHPDWGVDFKPRCIDFGPFRLGRGGGYLALVHRDGPNHTMIWAAKNDGSCEEGPVPEWPHLRGVAREEEALRPVIGKSYVQIGAWRIGEFRNRLLVVNVKRAELCAIFRADGRHFYGPFPKGSKRYRFFQPFFEREEEPTSAKVKFCQGGIEFGNWRIGQANREHFVISCLSREGADDDSD